MALYATYSELLTVSSNRKWIEKEFEYGFKKWLYRILNSA